jgi:VWFA-related protein
MIRASARSARAAVPAGLLYIACALLFSTPLIFSVPLLAQAIQRSLHVSALDEAGNPVPDLGPSDFTVREDKVTREVLRVERATDPMQIALLVDDSPAVSRYLNDFRSALTTFIGAVQEDKLPVGHHSMAIITFAARPTIKTNYTTDRATLEKGAQNIFPQQASYPTLLDAIAEASDGLSKQHAPRPVIVAVTTEAEDASFRHYDQVLESLRDSGAMLYVFDVGSQTNAQQDRSIVLGQGTESSGGHFESVLAPQALGGRMTRLVNELTRQYRVTYARPNSLIPPEQVSVSSAKPGVTARGILINEENSSGRR